MKELHIPKLAVPVQHGVSLASRTTWKMGGPAQWFVQPANDTELKTLLQTLTPDLPRFILGGGSNVLFDEGGFNGVVIDLTQGMKQIELVFLDADDRHSDEVFLQVQAGVSTRFLSHFARRNGLTGIEFLGGIPGSVGGALRMNAGAYGGEIGECVVDVTVMDLGGDVHRWKAVDVGFSYRKTQVPKGWLFLSARLCLRRGNTDAIRQKMQDNNRKRRLSQPLMFPSAGSTFKNPPNGPKAWQWIDDAGMRGVKVGMAQVSRQHTNFFVNRGGANSHDMRFLIDLVRERVLKKGGVSLALEVSIVGPSGVILET